MGFTTALGSLLGGATEEAGKIHQERYQSEQADRKFTFDTLTHIMDDPSIGNPQVKEEALQELHGRLMQTMFPDQFSHKPGKLGKLVDQFVGMQNPRGPMGPMTTAGAGGPQQFGAGTGNAKGQLGTLPPPQQSQDPTQSTPSDQASPQANGSGGMLGDMQPPAQALGTTSPSGFMDPYAQAHLDAYRQGMAETAKQAVTAQYAGPIAQAATTGKTKGEEQTLGFDIPQLGLKKGAKISPEQYPLIDTFVKATMPEVESVSNINPAGDKIITLIDKKATSPTFNKTLGTTDVGPSMEAVRSGLTESIKAFERDNGRLPTQKETMAIAAEYEKNTKQAGAQITIDIGTALAKAREDVQKDLYGANDPEVVNDNVDRIFDGTQQITQVPANGGLRTATMRAFADRIANGEKPPIPLTPAGSTTVAQTAPVLQMVQRLKAAIGTFKDSNIPLSEALQAQLYGMGISTDQSGTIAQAELLKVVGAGRVMRGVSRNMDALELAMKHLPNIRIDSGKLMYDKLDNLETNLRDVVNGAYRYERKSGALPLDTSPSPAGAAPKQSYKDWLATQPK